MNKLIITRWIIAAIVGCLSNYYGFEIIIFYGLGMLVQDLLGKAYD